MCFVSMETEVSVYWAGKDTHWDAW